MPDTIDYKFNFWFFFILFIGFAASTIMLHAVTDRLQSELNASRLEFSNCSQALYVSGAMPSSVIEP